MLKKPASFVLASLRGSTLSRSFSEVGNAGRAFPFAKTHYKGERPTRSAVRTSSPLRLLRPCWTAFLSTLRWVLLLSQTYRPVTFRCAHRVFPQPAITSHIERAFHNRSKKEIASVQHRKRGLRRLLHHVSRHSGFDHHNGSLHHRREKARQRARIFIRLQFTLLFRAGQNLE